MSKTARTPYKTKMTKKRKDVRAARAVKNSVSDAAELWIAPNKQFCLQPSLECRQRWRRSDIGRQTVPHASHVHIENARSPTIDRRVTGTTRQMHAICETNVAREKIFLKYMPSWSGIAPKGYSQ